MVFCPSYRFHGRDEYDACRAAVISLLFFYQNTVPGSTRLCKRNTSPALGDDSVASPSILQPASACLPGKSPATRGPLPRSCTSSAQSGATAAVAALSDAADGRKEAVSIGNEARDAAADAKDDFLVNDRLRSK
jgi:hypothetical protein